VSQALEVFQLELIDGHERDDPRVVHEDVEATKNFHRFGDGVFHRFDLGVAGANGQGPATSRFDGAHHFVGFLRRVGVAKRDGPPSAASRLAIAAPMPRDPPVTSATLPVSFFDTMLVLSLPHRLYGIFWNSPGQTVATKHIQI
jgi:hypothetical protein